MNKRVLVVSLFVISMLLIVSAGKAQDATQEATPALPPLFTG